MENIKLKSLLLFISFLISFIAYLSVVQYINTIYSAIFGLLFLIGILVEKYQKYLEKRWLINTFAILFVVYKVITVSLEDPIISIVEALVILLGFKLIEKKRFRDYLQIYVISVFIFTGSALLSIDLVFLIYFISLSFLITTAIVLLAFYSEKPELVFDRKTSLKVLLVGFLIPIIATPFAIFLFIVLPRTDYPLFSFLNHNIKANTGFSDSVELGDVSDIQEDKSVVMRVQMPVINPSYLYWRGIVLSFFDGKVWKRIETLEKEAYTEGIKINQTVILEPYGDKYLFALDKPAVINIKNIKGSDDFLFYLPHKFTKRLKYQAVSVVSNTILSKSIHQDIYLQLPEDVKNKLSDLAEELRGKTQVRTVYNILNYLNQNYHYSLQDLPKSSNPVVEFLLKHKKGNCEFFASAAAVLLRLNKIPVRLVAGYKGGYYNNLGGYYVIPQKNAHVWIEVYLQEKWVRFDPTPAPLDLFIRNDRSVKDNLKLLIDALEYFWIKTVINFDFQKQTEIFNKIKTKLNFKKSDLNKNIDKNIIIKAIALFILLAVTVFISIKLVVFLKTPKEKRILNSFYKKLEKYGYIKKDHEGLMEFVSKIENYDLRTKALQFVIRFESVFYKDKHFSKEDIKKLKDIISSI